MSQGWRGMKTYQTFLADFGRERMFGSQIRDVLNQSEQPKFDVRFHAASRLDCAVSLGGVADPIADFLPALALLAFDQPPGSALMESLRREIRHRNWHCPLVVIAPARSPGEAVESFQGGAADVWLPPLRPVEILARATHWAEQTRSEEDESIRQIKSTLGLDQFVGESTALLSEIQKIPAIAVCPVTVMIRGETGTGKEICARAIHQLSPRNARPFVPINCAALPLELIENELFGHETGAFTGANGSSPGIIEQAAGGSLFLDEIDSLPLPAQAKLLRFLQDKEYRRLGSSTARTADVRLLAATNADLASLIQQGRFRQDLFYRLSVVELKLPPLRDRGEDIQLLARHYLGRYALEFKKPVTGFSSEAQRKLRFYQWPGNVRELENVVARGVVLAKHPIIGQEDLVLPGNESAEQPMTFKQLKARALHSFEQAYLTELLQSHHGNISRAAAAAGKERRTFWQLLRKHRLTNSPAARPLP